MDAFVLRIINVNHKFVKIINVQVNALMNPFLITVLALIAHNVKLIVFVLRKVCAKLIKNMCCLAGL